MSKHNLFGNSWSLREQPIETQNWRLGCLKGSGPTNGQEGDGFINVKRSDDGNPDDTNALLNQNWWESKQPMGDGAVNVKRSDDQDGSPEDTDALLPQNWWESKEPMGDGAASVKRAGADPRGCRG